MHRTYGPPAAICALVLCLFGFFYQAHADIFTVAPRQSPGDCFTDPNGVCCASGSLGDPNDPCVPADFCALNDALAAAQVGFGDTVIVMPGTYYENVNMKNDVKLLGSGPAVTIIDGCASGPVMSFSVNGGPDTVVSGFTIRNGSAEKGGGLFIASTAGPSLNGGQQVITRNIIEGSTAYAVGGYNGVGGGIAVYRQSPTITNNLIRNNDADQFGGGISLNISNAVITNNTVTGNTVTSVHNPPTTFSVGGGFDIYTDYNNMLLSNNVLEGNGAGTGGGIYQLAGATSTVTNRYSAFSGNTGGDCDTDDFVCTGSGNISSSCQFVNSGGGDHRLLFGSPCIDTGNDGDAPGDGVDLVDEQRILDGDNNFTATIDMGAIEHCENDPDGDTVSNCTDNCLETANTSQDDTDVGGGDGVGDACDNCVATQNSGQEDGDSDTVGDACDNCVSTSNSNQNNLDGDSEGDACDADDDNDGIADGPDTNDTDPDICGDSDADTCDDCAVGTDDFGPLSDSTPSNDGLDTDSDGACDAGDTDDDNDTILDGSDNCPLVANTPQTNTDGDSEGDACDDDDDNDTILDVSDNCPLIANTPQANFDGDSEGDLCDDDDDNDGVDDGPDTSPNDPDVCGDTDADTCEDCSIGTDDLGPLSDSDPSNDGLDTDSDGACDVFDTDDDNDTVLDGSDNCPVHANTNQDDTDVGGPDGVGDACDNCPVDMNSGQEDGDSDMVGDICDNCEFDANTSQSDMDADTIGDACDLDVDGDTVLDDGDLDGNSESPGGLCRSIVPLTSGCDDCDQDNATAWALAGQVPNLHWTSMTATVLAWDMVDAADLMTYSVMRGRISVMRGDGNITGAICLVKDITNLQYNAPALPAFSGPDGHYYLVGAENSCDPFPYWGTGNDSGTPSARFNPQCDFGFPF